MAKPLEELRKVRLEKLKKIKKLGINPYAARCQRKHSIAQALKMMAKQASVAGRIMSMRGHGGIEFLDLQDESGKIQLVFKSEKIKGKNAKLLSLLDIGDFIDAQGKIFKTDAGEISVLVDNFHLLTKSLRPLPSKWHGLKDVEERYRRRYVDLIMNPEVKKRLEIRDEIIISIREFLNKKGYVEVETPTFQPVYGGGLAKPFVTHHNALDSDFYLRISDEMYLKRLIVGGFEKVYEITKVFRNEGIDRNHNPEFTLFEAMTAFEDYNFGMNIIEEIIEGAAKKVLGTTKLKYQNRAIDVKRPWKRLKVVEAAKKYAGVDPSDWKSITEAKRAISKLGIKAEKLKKLGKMRTIGEMIAFVLEEIVEEKLIQPTITYDYPIEVSPLAKKCRDPRFTQRFEMFAAGFELGNNYTELTDPLDLEKRFIEEKKRKEAGFEEAHQADYDYLSAIEYGLPPTCGIAIAIDRLAMLFTDVPSIREVIAFPILRPERKKKT